MASQYVDNISNYEVNQFNERQQYDTLKREYGDKILNGMTQQEFGEAAGLWRMRFYDSIKEDVETKVKNEAAVLQGLMSVPLVNNRPDRR